MAARPSAPLLALLRKVAKDRGLNTAALARELGVPRGHLKHVLAGSKDLTVDEFIQLAQVLELDAAQLTGLPEPSPESDGEEEAPEGAEDTGGRALSAVDRRSAPRSEVIDPYGNHAEQALRLGFTLGVDLHLVLDTAQLGESGVPKDVMARYEARLPLRLDAAYHRHHDPRFLPEGVSLKMSFDALYDCFFPWASFVQITLFPLPPDEPEEEEPEPPEDEGDGPRRGHLRLVT